MKKMFKFLTLCALCCLSLSTFAQTPQIALKFGKRLVTGNVWTFELLAKGNDAYVPPIGNDWISMNIRMDITFDGGDASARVQSGSGVSLNDESGKPYVATAGVSNQVFTPGPPTNVKLGLILSRASSNSNLNADIPNDRFVAIASFTIVFDKTISANDIAVPRQAYLTSSGSFWNNSVVGSGRRPFILDDQFRLPVKLVSFDATREGESANLVWRTSEETNSDQFEIQRSADGKSWAKIGSVKSNGESNVPRDYTFTDNNPLSGENLYRLRMVDFDGTFAYSKIESLRFNDIASYVYPNPVVNSFVVKGKTDSFKSLSIINLSGKVVYEQQSASKTVDVAHLPNGSYIVQLTTPGGETVQQKIVIRK